MEGEKVGGFNVARRELSEKRAEDEVGREGT